MNLRPQKGAVCRQHFSQNAPFKPRQTATSQRRNGVPRATLSLTGFGSSPRRFAARLAAEARRLACGSAYATRPSKLSCSLRISTDTTNLPDPLVISELLEVRAGGCWGLAPRPPGKRLVCFEFILFFREFCRS